MKKNITITIGIPAFNEEKNIGVLLKNILSQKTDNIIIKNIIVISDRSTDKTEEIVKNTKDKRVLLIRNKRRLGKSGSVKQLFFLSKKMKSQILVVMDADITLKGKEVIKRLVSPFQTQKNLFIACGVTLPHKPFTFIEKIGYFGTTIINETIKRNTTISDYYRSTDQLLAIRLAYLNEQLIKKCNYMHDEFFYLLTQKQAKDFLVVKNAIAFYKLPKTFKDYSRQMVRFLGSNSISSTYFKSENIQKYTNFTYMDKLHTFFKYAFKSPLIAVSYISIQIMIHMKRKLTEVSDSPIWETVTSTK